MDDKTPIEDDNCRDKESAAVHEAGHATVAAVFCWREGKGRSIRLDEPVAGLSEVCLGRVAAHIRRTQTNDPMCEKTWVGSTTHWEMDLDVSDKATINVAGIVAECLVEDDQVEADEIVDYWESEVIEPSDTDYKGIPDSWEARSAAVERALRLLREHSALLKAVAAELVRSEAVTDGVLKALLERFGNQAT